MPPVQTPAAQDCPLAQERPHVPQFATSVYVLTHTPPHIICPLAVHVGLPPVQAPATQV